MATSLEKSHSKLSNFKLTILILLTSLSIPIFIFGWMFTNINEMYGTFIMIFGGILFLLTLIWLSKFKR